MKPSEIIVAGAAIVDVLVRPASPQVFLSGSWPAQEIRMEVGGDAVNEASVLTVLGKSVDFTGILGQDSAAEVVRQHCRQLEISTDHLKICPHIPTGINVVLVEENGERSFLTNAEGSLRKLSAEDIVIEPSRKTGIFSFASIFVSPLIGPEELKRIFQRAKAQKLLVCADTTKRKQGERLEDLREVWPLVDYLFPNQEEAALLTGQGEADWMADQFLDAGVGCVVMKRGAKGCLIKTKEMKIEIPAVQGITCVDTTGAGDSFAAGFLCGLSEGKPLSDCGILANACGSLAVETVGAVRGIRSREQVEKRAELLRRQMGIE